MELPTNRSDYSKSLVDPETGEFTQVHNREGAEVPDPVPVAPPIGYERPVSMFDQMRAQIRAEHYRLRQMELEQLAETREQASDFDVDEDVENMPSLYEEKFDPVDFEVRSRLRQQEFAASVDAELQRRNPQKEVLLDGSDLEQGRKGDREGSSGGGDRKPQSRGGKKQTSGVQGSVRQGSDGDPGGDGED